MSAGATTPDRLAGLSREQRARLFEQVRKRRERVAAPPVRIPRRPAGLDAVPASFAQERLWFMDRMAPGNVAYNIPMALRIEGSVAPATLELVLGEVVRRHEALRTTFTERDGQPVQVIAPPGAAPFRLPVVDLAALAESARGDATRRLAQSESQWRFRLESGPLLRAVLLRLGAREHALLLVLHHIVSDGWSMGVLAKEIMAIWAAVAQRASSGASTPDGARSAAGAAADGGPLPLPPPSSLPPLPIQYADFALWQREWLSGAELERQVAYWRQRLAGAPVALDLPADRPRPALQTYRGAQLRAPLSAGFTRRLRQLARRYEASPYMVLLAGFQALLGRLTGQHDLAVGSPIANRNRAELEPLIGFFVNTLVMRGDLAGDPPFGELLARTRQAALEAYAHQDLPFERLVVLLRPERRLSVTPLFQVVCAMQNAPVDRLELPGLALSSIDLDVKAAQFDLELHAWEVGDVLLAVVGFSTELFDGASVRRLLGQLETLLGAALEDPGRRLAALPLLSTGERQQLLREWQDMPAGLAATGLAATGLAATGERDAGERDADGRAAAALGIAARVAARAALDPAAPAVAWPGGELLYGELLARASRLAAELRALGVGPETRVGLCAGRSPELVIGALAVLLAGAAYLPLDPSTPRDRLALIARESGIAVLLVAAAGAPPAASAADGLTDAASWAGPGVHVLRIERPAPGSSPAAGGGVAASDGERLGSHAGAQLAYVIYTSGSTGRPKGVEIPLRGLDNLVAWHLRAYGVSERDRSALLASPAFDASVWEIWPYLVAGASLHIPDEEVRLEPPRLLAWLAEEGITLCHPTTPLAEPLLAAAEAGLPPGLRLRAVLTGADRLQRRPLPGLPFDLVNHYGPTEGSVVATCARVGPAPAPGAPAARPPAIGRPLGGASVYVVDARLDPVPAGMPGELLLGGAGLARGYGGRPDLTAERFIPDSLGGAPGERLYRTGDLVRWLADGNLEFLGRLDSQVKLRGFRIELGEIGAALQRHPAVAAAVVGLVDAGGGQAEAAAGAGRQLAAWIVPRTAAELAAAGGGWRPPAAEHVAHWQTLYDETYGTAGSGLDADGDLRGWNSSYTGMPIPPDEMREWIDHTVERLVALAPRRVLEIGCGTGLLLFRVAPRSESYLGTDFSRVALDGIRRRLAEPGRHLPQVALREAEAGDWRGIAAGSADLVVLNSVSQYFPGISYLLRVLESAVRATAPGGAVFVGDVRSLPLLPALAASVELFQAPAARGVRELRRRIRRRVAGEEELVVDPAFFQVLAQRLPAVREVSILQKRGRPHNELTRFRYDVVLRIGGGATAPPAAGTVVDATGLDLSAIGRLLDGPPGGAGCRALVLTRLANARLAGEAAALELLDGGPWAAPDPSGREPTAGELRLAVAARLAGGVDPEDLWQLADGRGWEAELTVDPAAPFRFGAVLRRRGAPVGELPAPAPRGAGKAGEAGDDGDAGEAGDARPWEVFANDPLRGEMERRLVPELRRALAAELPDYMVPAAFSLLDRLPLTPHGKVDHAALPPPEAWSAGRQGGTAPRSGIEARLAALWQDVLGISEIAREDNFFELGGHSLLATQLVSRARGTFGIDLPLRRLFERPVLADLAADLAEQLAAAGRLQAVDAGATPPAAAAAPSRAASAAPRRVEAPLSFAQERFWAASRHASTAYNVPFPLRLLGTLDPGTVERCFREVLRRHGALRTRFVERDGTLYQVVDPPGPWSLPRIDLCALGEAARAGEAGRLVDEEAGRPFDLARGPLLRATLVRLSHGEHLVLLNAHHIVVDGWSTSLLVGELIALYRAFGAGLPSPLPELPAQYVDLAVAQRRRLSGAALAVRLEHWRRRLQGAPALLSLPLDRPRPAALSHRGERIDRLLPAELLRRLEALSVAAGASLFMTVLAGLALLLQRWSGQDDLVVGSPVAGRLLPESEPLIGVFLNLLPLRIDLAGHPTFGELLERVRQTALDAYEHQEFPFEQLIEQLGLRRDRSHNPIFQITLNMLNLPPVAGDLPGSLAVEPIPAAHVESKYDFTLYAFEVPDGLALSLLYCTDLFGRPRMEELLTQLASILEQAAAAP